MPAGLSEVDMQTYVDGLDRFLSDHHNEVIVALALRQAEYIAHELNAHNL